MGRSCSRHQAKFGLFLILIAICGPAATSRAAIVTLSHNNSVARIDVDNPNPASAGMLDWEVQGQDQLQQQWFWYRVGSDPEQPINAIGAPVVSTFLGTRGLTTTYANANFSVSIDYLLTGGTSVPIGSVAHSDVAETISIHNTSGEELNFHFFQYSNFDLTGGGDDSVVLGTDPFGKFNSAFQSDGVLALTEAVTVAAPSASHGEAGLYSATFTRLNDALADVLNDIGSAGPGDVTWGFQWDINLAPGATFIISKDKHLQVVAVPEPSTMAATLLGLLACKRRNRRASR
jgi:hypothetical protein